MLTSFVDIAERLKAATAVLPGKKVRLDTGPGGSILLDGVDNRVKVDGEGDVDAAIDICVRELGMLVDGQIDTTVAFLLGKFKFAGELPILFQLQSVFLKARR